MIPRVGKSPESDYVDDSAYELLLQSRHIDWEGEYRDMLPRMTNKGKR